MNGGSELDKIHPAMFAGAVAVALLVAYILAPGDSLGSALLMLHVLGAVGCTIDLVRMVQERGSAWGVADILWLLALWLVFLVGSVVWVVSGRRLFHLSARDEHR